jgi:Ribosome biogenesis protein Nop16
VRASRASLHLLIIIVLIPPCFLHQLRLPGNRLHTLALERLGTGSVTPRHSSAGELTYLQRLLTRHGTNVAAMAVDHGLNYEQRTEGELRRGLYRAGVGGEE